MWSVPNRGKKGTRTVAGADSSGASTADSFSKDGRKISVGDCALFRPPQDGPPFIGIIRCLTLNRENYLQLGVNWLYRPAELKLGKRILLDAAPNEIFYSFHKDEIPAASLLHPCKVAFLPKGVELPSGIPSFVCHRVYDIANKCLWWLTDRDFIDERQEEVKQLLRKTRIEMHAAVQPSGRSPKSINGPTSTSQLKHGADNVQSATSLMSQAKGKKRERADQGSEPVKRERSSKTNDGDSGQLNPESILISEISKITENGGLVDSGGVEKLIQLMRPDRTERKKELINRSMLAGVIISTEKFDCLSQFVQLKGLHVLDDWLQDVKGKIGDGSPRDGDKPIDEFLLVLLHALDKLPVNLHALQMCNIGKSVNHLRLHRNLEIQKKARSIVDTWKKRVEAEMTVIDAKSVSTQAVSWPSRSRLPEVSHGGNRHPSGSCEVATRSSVTQLSASKTASIKAVQGEFTAKSTSSSPGPMKSAASPSSCKDGRPKMVVGSGSDFPSTIAREERSSSSSQSHNNSQSCSSDHAKTAAFSGKEDARSSTAGSMSVNKMSGGGSRHRRTVNGFPGPAVSGGQRQTGSSRSSSVHRISASEKLSESGLTCEKALEVPITEGNCHKLIVKIPNRGRSPAQSASGGSVDDPSIVNSRTSSPVLPDKHDQYDRESKYNSDAIQVNIVSDVNTESWQSNDFKDVLTASDEGDGSPGAILDDDLCRIGEETVRLDEVSKAASSSSMKELKSGKLLENSFRSMNALIESCVKYSKGNASMAAGDDVGMNLLASVAAGEMSKSDLISSSDSPRRNRLMVEDSYTGDDLNSNSHGNNVDREQSQSANVADADNMEQGVIAGSSWSRDALHHLSRQATGDISGDRKTTSPMHELAPNRECNEFNSSSLNAQSSAGPYLDTDDRSDELTAAAAASSDVSPDSAAGKVLEGDESKHLHEKTTTLTPLATVDSIQDTQPKGRSSLLTEDKVKDKVKEVTRSTENENGAGEGSSSDAPLENDGKSKNNVNEVFNGGQHTEQKPPSGKVQSVQLEQSDEELQHHSCFVKNLPPESVGDLNCTKADEIDTISHSKRKNEHGTHSSPSNEHQVVTGLGSAVSDQKSEDSEWNVDGKQVLVNSSVVVVPQKVEQHARSGGSNITGLEVDGTEKSASTVADASSFPAAGVSDGDTKLKFDLNEGFVSDEGKYGGPINLAGPGCSAPGHLVNPVPFPVSSVSLPASITVAAAAKGPFVPPEDLLRSKGELGWKGSAATSAFRPAEPRKVLEMQPGTTNIIIQDDTAEKHGRPLLDFDLNVPDERILEDMASPSCARDKAAMSDKAARTNHLSNYDSVQTDLIGSTSIRSSGGLDLDLNRVDEASDMGQYSTSSSRRMEALLLPVKSASGGFPNCEVRRDFDLNNGPILDEANAEPMPFSQHGRSNMQSQPPLTGLRMNNAEMGTISSWFTTGNPYPALTREQPFPIIAMGGPPKMLAPVNGGNPYTPDVYHSSGLSSSRSLPFPSTPFQYPVYPFGATFPLPSANFTGGPATYMDSSSAGRLTFPTVNSQLLGPAAAVSPSQYPRPYIVSLPENSNNTGIDNHRRWGGLDLNFGPVSLDTEGRDETSSLALRQLPIASSQAQAEEQARMYQQMVGGNLKRKEPEGRWESESFMFKQSSWP